MIASIFKNSKPFNFVIVLVILFLVLVFNSFNLFIDSFSIDLLLKLTFAFLINVFSVLLLNFIVVKNKLNEQNSYHILLYTIFLIYFPSSLTDINLLLSNVFVLLALRRIISLRSQINLKKKLFDASFWIAIAALFYFWALAFLILIFAALFLFSDNRLKNWIIPFTGVLTVLILLTSYQLVKYDNIEALFSSLPRFNFDFSNYNSKEIIIASTLLLSFGIWGTFFYINKIKNQLKAFKPSHKIIIAAVIIALLTVVLSEDKTTSEFIFLFAPLAVIINNYIETIEENWFRETFLIILVLAPFVLLVL